MRSDSGAVSRRKLLEVALVLDRRKTPTPPPQGMITVDDLQKHTIDIDFFLRNCVVKGDVTINDATNSTDVVSRFNELLTALRTSGVIA